MRHLLAAIALVTVMAAPAQASPVWLNAEASAAAYKWGDSATFSGAPEFGRPRFNLDLALEWSPAPSSGLYIVAGFRYVALGDVPGSPLDQRFVDGPRLGLKWRGRLVP